MTFAKTALLAGALTLASSVTALSLAGEASAQSKKVNWNLQIERKDSAHLIGNPNASAKLTEYVSYTCGHCATFAAEGDPRLKLVYIPTGRVSVEVRHVIRDPVDWTVAVLAHCGEAKKFPLNHSTFMAQQDKWLSKTSTATQAQRTRWQNSDRTAARRAIASDLGLDTIMLGRGYSRIEIDRCLADNDAARTLAIQSIGEAKRMGVSGTPSFALNGQLLEGTHNWPSLYERLEAHFAAKPRP